MTRKTDVYQVFKFFRRQFVRKKMTRKTDVYQVEFEKGYGYFQELGQVEKDGRIAHFIIVFEKIYALPIDNFSLLQESASYITHSRSGIIDQIRYNREINDYWLQKFAREKIEPNILCYPYWDNSSHTIHKGIAKISKVGKYRLFKDYEIPQMLRTIEFNLISNTYKWVVMTPFDKFIKFQKSCKGIEHLPPREQPILMTIYRWTDGIGEKEWNDEYCKKLSSATKKSKNNQNRVSYLFLR